MTFTGLVMCEEGSGLVVRQDGSLRPVWFQWVSRLFLLFSLAMLYDSVLNVPHVLYSPFGVRPLDVPHDTMATQIRRLGAELMDGKSRAPHSPAESKDSAAQFVASSLELVQQHAALRGSASGAGAADAPPAAAASRTASRRHAQRAAPLRARPSR